MAAGRPSSCRTKKVRIFILLQKRGASGGKAGVRSTVAKLPQFGIAPNGFKHRVGQWFCCGKEKIGQHSKG